MSKRSDEYELRIDALPPTVDALDISFAHGNYITDTIPLIEVQYSQHLEERKTDNIVSPTRLGLLINRKVKDVFDNLNVDNIQYFKTRLIEANSGDIDENYIIANIVGKYSCIDDTKSDLQYFNSGNIKFINKLVLDLDPQTDYGHIFRLGECPVILVISEQLKTRLENSGVTGFKIYQPEDFSL